MKFKVAPVGEPPKGLILETIFDKEAAVRLQKHYRLREVAELCAVSTKTVYRWVYEGRLKAHRVGGSVRVPRSELLKIIQPIV